MPDTAPGSNNQATQASTPTRVVVIGAGAIGAFYGAILKRAGVWVEVVMRSDAALVREQGFVIDSPLGDLSYRPDVVHDASHGADLPADKCPAPDYVICCVKVLPGIDRAALIAPWLGPTTQVVLIENGINIEPMVADALPDHALISCLAFIGVSRVSPGRIEHKAFGRLTMGAWPSGNSTGCQALGHLFEAGGIAVKQTESVVRERWAKSVWNTPFNPISVLADGADTVTMLDTPGGEARVRACMAEVLAVAAADGHELPADAIDRNIEGTRAMPAYRNSMALDYLAHRPMEIAAILGNVVAIAQRLAVDVPHLRMLDTLLSMRDVQAASGR